jgi:phospholipase/carboxylesterase
MNGERDLHHLRREPLQAGAGPHPAVVFLHGRGADEQDLFALAEMFDPRLLFLSVRAPNAYPWGGFTWYESGPDGSPDPEMFRTACDRLLAFLRDVPARFRVDPQRIVLFGFSMGAAMAHAVLLGEPALVRAAVAASGYLPEGAIQARWDALGGKDILITHGTEDPVLPIGLGRRARDLYSRSPIRLLYQEFPGGHEITDGVIAAADTFLTGIIDAPPEPRHA